MQSSTTSSKCSAPATSPMMQRPTTPGQPAYPYQQMSDNQNFTNYDFSQPLNADQTFHDHSMPDDANNFSYLQNSIAPPSQGGDNLGFTTATPSTDLVRRMRNQQLAPQNSSGLPPQEQWNGGAYGNVSKKNDDEDERELDRRVQEAKREAQGKRKQIPPFVQKLSSFLDSNNTDLIRWSEDGRSFIVLDEDEFARTLIPELFKHNNYASFVRQLNMYGFHKTVHITDGSLRQSEKARKGVKPPSMYSHPYFRKNRPDLLWLIQKPSTKAGGKRKRDGNIKEGYDSDDERQFSPGPGNVPQGELGAPTNTNRDLAQLPRNELASVRRELQQLQNQQRFISQMITQLKEQNDHFYRQATAFQALHDRHENSINAILTFLATFYNRNLDGAGAQNLVNMFSNVNQTQQQQDQSRVVEEFNEGTPDGNQQLQRYRKPQLLLPGPVANSHQPSLEPGTAATTANTAQNSHSPSTEAFKRESTTSKTPHEEGSSYTASPQVKNDTPTPNTLQDIPENDQMMSLINDINRNNASATPATNSPAYDFSSALDQYQNANGNAPLTSQQRDDMLALIANRHGNDPSQNNALISPHPPAMPDLKQVKESQQRLEMLTNMQKQQNEKVQELNRRLQPLSPTGSIPGIAPHNEDDFFSLTGAPGDYDPNAFINFDEGNWNGAPAGGDENLNFDFGNGAAANDGDLNWNFNHVGTDNDMFQTSNDHLAPHGQHLGEDGGGKVESVSSEATSPAMTVGGGGDGEHEQQDPGTPRKKARKS